MKILLIYELIPESTKFYLFDNVNPNSELYEHLLGANGHYTNYEGPAGDNEHTDFLNEYLTGEQQTEVGDVPFLRNIDVVVHSGFGL